jgi:aspartyl-tRNA synthetase
MDRVEIGKLKDLVGKEVKLFSWINSVRSHGKVIFFDLRDNSGIVQSVVFKKELLESAEKLKEEDLVEIIGTVNPRPEKLANPNQQNGDIEIAVTDFKLVSKSKLAPFDISQDTKVIDEVKRLRHRYLDLRSARMHQNIITRHKLILALRNYLSNDGFLEIETPILTKGTPEGAREFIVPSRQRKGSFFVLPQSPQQYKQLLMVAGFEKYFQIARCFRDEDQRGDRQPEFTQLDIEMSFVSQEKVMALVEKMIIDLVTNLFPNKRISKKPFPVLTYEEAIKNHNSDKPDLRENKEDGDELAFLWVEKFPLFEYSETEKKYVSVHHPFTRPLAEDMEYLEKDPSKVRSYSYDLVLNGFEIGGGSIRIHEKALQEEVFKYLGLTKETIKARFGHLVEAFEYSPPPHGGIALGLDRLIAILQNEPNIREVIAFPKTGESTDPLTGAPTSLPDQSLNEVGIKVKEEKRSR